MKYKKMINIKPIKYFNNLDFLNKNKVSNGNIESLNEKIILEFSLQNVKDGDEYSINAYLLDKNITDYNSEQKISYTDNNIIFEKFFICDYYFEKEQKLEIKINKNKSVFSINTTLGCIIGSRNCTFIKKYEEQETLIVKAEKMGKNDTIADIKFLIKKNGKDSNYFENNKLIYIITCNGNKIYSSENINDNGEFNSIEIPSCLLLPYYTVNFYNYYDQLISSFNKTIEELECDDQDNLQLKIPISNKNYLFLYDNSRLKENYTFLDYINAGIRIGLSIGIDFTGSNGHPLDKGTLHSLKGKKPNDYERAIKACGKIVANYDYAQLFPVYGFGAILNSSKNKESSMCFNLNFKDNPEIYTIDNIIKEYHECIEKDKLTFSGPTEFSPIINTVISKIKNNQLYYHILMILTDGVIDDLHKTIDALVDASFEPLSIIIIGIGDADFKKMEILNGDAVPLVSSKGKKRTRNLVQFFPFSKFQNDENKLSVKVLEEIPKQIVDYYNINKLNPNKIKELISQNKKIEVKNENPCFENGKPVLNWDSIQTNETIILGNNNNNPSKQINVYIQEINEGKGYTNLPPNDFKYEDIQKLSYNEQTYTNRPPDDVTLGKPKGTTRKVSNYSIFDQDNF